MLVVQVCPETRHDVWGMTWFLSLTDNGLRRGVVVWKVWQPSCVNRETYRLALAEVVHNVTKAVSRCLFLGVPLVQRSE